MAKGGFKGERHFYVYSLSTVLVLLVPALWSILLSNPTSAMMSNARCKAAFAIPPLASSVGSLLRFQVSGENRSARATAGSCSPWASKATSKWPIFARKPLIVLRGGMREGQDRSLSVTSAKNRAPNDDESMGGDVDGATRAKEPRSSKGDLVDIDAATGAELRRRSRGRGRSLTGYVLQEDGDWVRYVGEDSSALSAKKGKQIPHQKTLSPFLATRKGVRQESSGDSHVEKHNDRARTAVETSGVDTSAPPASPHDEQSSQPEGRIADEILSAMGAMHNLEIHPLDESLWEDLPSKASALCIL